MASEWRLRLLPASFRGVEFHVEESAKSGGRRAFLHEFAKRDLPYAEDMGRKGRGYTVTGYIVGRTYREDRDALIEALETEGPGTLILPTAGEQIVQPGPYSAIERRERGRWVEISMNFLEAGTAVAFGTTAATQAQVRAAASAAASAITSSTAGQLEQAGSATPI